MSKKLKTRKGNDGYNYPYTHQDLIFNDEGTGLSQQLENFATKDFVNDSISNAQLNSGPDSSTNQELSAIRSELEKKANKSDLKAVATSGSYNDLSNKPIIPSIEGLATESFVTNKIAEAQLNNGGEVNLEGLATKDELNLKADKNYVDGFINSGQINISCIDGYNANILAAHSPNDGFNTIYYSTKAYISSSGSIGTEANMNAKAFYEDGAALIDKYATKEYIDNAIDSIPEGFSGDYNDLENKPCYDNRVFEDYSIEYDGNGEGKEEGYIQAGPYAYSYFKKLADLSEEEYDTYKLSLSMGYTITYEDYEETLTTVESDSIHEDDTRGMLILENQYIVITRGTVEVTGGSYGGNMGFPSAGIYFENSTRKFDFKNSTGELKTLDKKFLPSVVGETVEIGTTHGDVTDSENTIYTTQKGAEIFNNYEHNIATGIYSHAEGNGSSAFGDHSHAEGEFTVASGKGSHAEGEQCRARGEYSHVEGSFTQATGMYSHAEGNGSNAIGDCSHAEGSTQAIGDCSHTEGGGAQAHGYCSHAEGGSTIASGDYQHVQGKYNIEDTEKIYAHIVGNGRSSDYRNNAHTLDWDGNAWFAGKVTASVQPTDNNDLTTKEYVDNAIAQASIGGEIDTTEFALKSELFSKNYNDLTNKPVIPSVQGLASESYVNQQISKIQHPVYDDTYIKNQLANKANKSELFSGDYNDLSNKPSIPSIAGLASESFVKNEIAKAQLEIEGEIPVINLDGLATKDELALKADKTEIPNIEGLASESYVQQEIAKAQVGGSGGSGSGSGDGGYVTDDNVSDEEKEYVDDMMYSALGGLKFVKTTQERYDALTDKDPNTIYIVVSPENMSNSTGGEEGVTDIYNLSWIDGVNLSDTGSLVTNDSQASYRTSDYIKINPEFSYRVNTSSSSQFQVFYYDKNKNYIGKSTIRNDKTEFALYGYEGFIEAPEDVKYFRIRTSNKTSSIEINEIGRKEDTPVAFQFRNGYTVASDGGVSAASGYMASGNIKLEPDYDYSITFNGNKTRIVFFNTDGNKTGDCLPTNTTYYNERITLKRTHIPEAAVSFRMRFATGGEVNMNNIHEHLVITRTPRTSKHLLSISTWMQSTGFDENGKEIEDISAMNTGYVQIESGYNYMYTLKRGVPFGFQIFYYDASQSFISNSEIQNDPVGNVRFNIPSNAAYFRIKVSQENSLTVDNANENIEIKKIPAVDGLLYSFGVLSDVHVDAGSDGNFYDTNHATSDYRKAVKFLEDEGAEFIAYGGDMATGDPGVSEQDYRKVLEILKNSHIPNYMISGNHDYGYFFKALIESRKYYTVEKGNDLFIFVNTQDRGATGGVDREIVDAVRAIIESNPNKRLFLFFHYFIRNHGAGDGATDVKYYTGDTLGDGYEKYPLSLEWANLIINTPNLIFCHGHSHFRFNCVNVYAQNNYSHVDGECHSVHIPSCAVPREMSADSTSVNNWPEGSEGYMVEVFADRVVFHAVQLSSYRYLTTYDFTIDLPQGN